MASPKVKVEGLRELRRELRRLARDDTWKADLRNAGMQAATVVATDARGSALGATNPRMGTRAANTIRPLASQRNARVAAGSNAVPWTMGHIWGSRQYPQFPPVKKGGYHLYPAIQRNADKTLEIYGKAIETLTRRAFPD